MEQTDVRTSKKLTSRTVAKLANQKSASNEMRNTMEHNKELIICSQHSAKWVKTICHFCVEKHLVAVDIDQMD